MAIDDVSLQRPVFGVALKLLSVLMLSSMAACVKYLGDEIPVGQIIFVRGALSVALIALIAGRVRGFGLHLLKTHNWRAHALRSGCGTLSMFCLFFALTMAPFAQVTAITFATPLFLTILAMIFLGERVHVFRWTAVAVGFVGVLVMLGPEVYFGSGFSLGLSLALATAVFRAFAMTFLRRMSRVHGEHAITITFYFSVTIMICAALTAFAGWPMPTPWEWTIIILGGLLGVTGQLLMTFSYRYAEASTIAPLDYANLLVAVAFGYYLFGEVPNWSIWVGAPLVVIAGLVILWREYRRTARGAPSAEPPTLATIPDA